MKTYDKAEIAHTFKIFLLILGQILQIRSIVTPIKSHSFYMNSNTLINFQFKDVDENTVIDVLRQLPLKSSFGFDSIPSHLLHNIELYLVKTTYTSCQTNP